MQEEEDPDAATGVRRSSRVRKQKPEYKALWQKQTVRTLTLSVVLPAVALAFLPPSYSLHVTRLRRHASALSATHTLI